jgi:DNA-binding HxlR family transcriptional regulator
MNTVISIAPCAAGDPAACPVTRTMRVISGRWKPLILYHLRHGPRRFNELRRLIPSITQRMLTQHLRELQADGVVSRQVFEIVPPRVEYALTDLGRSLMPILSAMADWGMARLAEEGAAA